MRGGTANYVGTYRPVGYAVPAKFAETFYKDLVQGLKMGEALQYERNKVRECSSIDWRTIYGSYDFVLKVYHDIKLAINGVPNIF